MDNNWFTRAGNLEENKSKDNGMSYFQRAGDLDEPIQTNGSFLKPAGNLDENIQANSPITATDLEKKLFGRVLEKTQIGYEEALARRNAAWKEYEEIDSRISNGTATKEDWERHDEVVEIYKREAKALETIEHYLKNNPNSVNKNEGKSSSVGFEIAGDLEEPKQNNSFKFEEKKEELKTPEEIKAWLKTIVSGVKKSSYEFGRGHQAFSSGRILVGLDELKEMVENGDNIISAEYFEALNMVDIEFESFKIPSKSR